MYCSCRCFQNWEKRCNTIYEKLKHSGYQVYPVNPHAKEIQGDQCFPDLASIPGKVDGVVIVTRPGITELLVEECVKIGVPRVWMHRSLGNSVSTKAVKMCKDNGIKVIAGGCPMMFCETVDFGHKCFKWIFKIMGILPKE